MISGVGGKSYLIRLNLLIIRNEIGDDPKEKFIFNENNPLQSITIKNYMQILLKTPGQISRKGFSEISYG